MESKRKNYSETDKQLLMSLVGKYKTIIENKSTKQIYVDSKKETWDKIAENFNSSADSGPRSAKQLKILYENMKREIRKGVAAEHQQKYLEKLQAVKAAKSAAVEMKTDIFRTGGGPSSCSISKEQELLLAELQGQIQPLENMFDSAADYMMEDIPVIIQSETQIQSPTPVETVAPTHPEHSLTKELVHPSKKKKRIADLEDIPVYSQIQIQSPTLLETVAPPHAKPSLVKESRKKRRIVKKKLQSAEQYRRLYFRQKYINAVREGKEQKIIRNLTIKKLELEIKKLE